MGRELLDSQLNGFEFSEDRVKMADNFEQAVQMMATAAEQLRKAHEATIEHFGDG